MKRLNDRTGNGHPGYHNFGNNGSGPGNIAGGEANRQDNPAQSTEQFRRSNVESGGNGSEIVLDLLHCAPQRRQQQIANNAQALYQQQGYQLLSTPSSSHPAQSSHAYNRYGFPAFAVAMAAGGHCASQTPTTPEATHNPFSSSTGPFNLQSIFSRRGGGGGGGFTGYNNPLTIGQSSEDGAASTMADDNAATSLPCSASMANNAFCGTAADLRGRPVSKFENEENNGNRIEDIASVLHALRKESERALVRQPKMELVNSEDTKRDGDEGGTSGGFVPENLNSKPPARVGRRSGNGGRGSRGSGAHGCPYCPKKFVETYEAEAHQESCARQRPFDCTHCGRRFRQKTSLVQHLRIHTDTRPYQCRFCTRNFKQKSHLDQHERIHTGVKPYVCKFCNKAFRQKSGQASHELTHANALVQQYQMKHEEDDDQHEELSEDDDEDGADGDEEGENDTGEDEPDPQESAQLRHHSASLSTEDGPDGNPKSTARN